MSVLGWKLLAPAVQMVLPAGIAFAQLTAPPTSAKATRATASFFMLLPLTGCERAGLTTRRHLLSPPSRVAITSGRPEPARASNLALPQFRCGYACDGGESWSDRYTRQRRRTLTRLAD